MEQDYRVGTRSSPLALIQTEEIMRAVKRLYPDVNMKIISIDTYGDKDKATPIARIEGTDFFTREIDDALINNYIDFAVHSAKDLPDSPRDGLTVAAVTDSIDPYDVLVSKSGLGLDELRHGARIGTSSTRRKTQLKAYRDDFEIIDIRGNVGERLERLNKSSLDAILIAAAGLIRLGLEYRISQRIPFDIMKPHPLQGALAVVARKEDLRLLKLLSSVNSYGGACHGK